MKAVNLIPSEHRRATASGKCSGGAYVVLGVLAVLLVMAVAYVMTNNSVNDNKSKAAAARQEADAAESKTKQLGSFTDFASIKDQRLAAVTAAAQTRFDWERFMRELSRVMPDGSWISNTSASVTGEGSAPRRQRGVDPAAVGSAEGEPGRLHAAPVRGCPHDGAPRADVPRDGSDPERVHSGVRQQRAQLFRAAGRSTSSTSRSASARCRPRARRPRVRHGFRRHSEVGRDVLDVRPRSQDPAGGHPGRRDRRLLVPPARAQAQGGIHRLGRGSRSRRSGATRPRRGRRRPPRRRPTSAATTPRSCASVRRFRPRWTCPACSCSWRAPPRAPASASRRSLRASASRPRLPPAPTAGTPPPAGSGESTASGGGRRRAGPERSRSGGRGRQQRRGRSPASMRPPRPPPARAGSRSAAAQRRTARRR